MTHAVILAIIQGLTEFLPISSSGHLLTIPALLGWQSSGLAFDVALNTGTFFAVLIYFWRTWMNLIINGLLKRQSAELKLIGLLIVATIPAALIGYIAEPVIDSTLRQPVIAAVMLIVFGLVLGWAEKVAKLKDSVDGLTWGKALLIGFAQSVALIPGVSRSGITMTTGLLAGLKKEAAAEFSFLLLAPISFGAMIVEFNDMVNAPNRTEMLVGAGISFLVGMAAIHLMLSWVKKYGFKPYVWYRVILGVILLALLLAR